MTTVERTIILNTLRSKIKTSKQSTISEPTKFKDTARAELFRIGIITKSGKLSKHFNKK